MPANGVQPHLDRTAGPHAAFPFRRFLNERQVGETAFAQIAAVGDLEKIRDPMRAGAGDGGKGQIAVGDELQKTPAAAYSTKGNPAAACA